jgi:L-aminopeptidase/D-esterase-like protein
VPPYQDQGNSASDGLVGEGAEELELLWAEALSANHREKSLERVGSAHSLTPVALLLTLQDAAATARGAEAAGAADTDGARAGAVGAGTGAEGAGAFTAAPTPGTSSSHPG